MIAHLNICSIRNKVHEIHQLLHAHDIHILSVNETWLDNTISDTSISVPGYTVYRADRDSRGGGVCIYVQNSLLAHPLPAPIFLSQTQPEPECLFIKVDVPAKPLTIKFIVCSIYRPPSARVDFWENLRAVFDHHSQYDDYVVLGDFNTDVLNPSFSSQYPHLLRFCSEYQLRNVVTSPTRHPSNTCIDLILVSPSINVSQPDIIPVDGTSDHHLLTTTVTFPGMQPLQNHKFAYVRKPGYSSIDYTVCNADMSSRLTDPNSPNLSEYVTQWTNAVNEVMNNHAPVRRVILPNCTRPRPQPWLTEHLKYLLQQRRHLHRKSRKDPDNQGLLQRYRSVRREGTLLNRRLKAEYMIKHFQSMKGNPRGQWALINKLSGRSKSRVAPKATLEDLTNTFEGVVTDNLRPLLLEPSAATISATFLEFQPVSEWQVKEQLMHLNTAKSAGSDELPPVFLKYCAESLCTTLTYIVNESLRTGEVPDSYKLAYVCPVYKTGAQDAASNYRPVSLLPVTSKLLEKFVLQQLSRHIKSNVSKEFLPHEQFAYRPRHNCEDALALAINRWQVCP